MSETQIRIANNSTVQDIRDLTARFRAYFGYSDTEFIDPIDLLDKITQKPLSTNGRFADYEVVPNGDPIIPPGNEAYTDYDEKKAYFRQRVLTDWTEGRQGRSIYTIFHEIGHLVLHCFQKEGSRLVQTNFQYGNNEDPEWQADVFAAELSMPYQGVKDLDTRMIISTYRVSLSAANKRYREIHPL